MKPTPDSSAMLLPLLFVLLTGIYAPAQQLQVLTQGRSTSLRGLSVVDNRIIWACGSNGTVARSLDGGLHWQWITVTDCAACDFRDIEAFNAQEAILLKVGEPGYLLRTTDGGLHWSYVYVDSTAGVFFDALAFSEKGEGLLIGDPLPGEHRIYSALTRDSGKTWHRFPNQLQRLPTTDSGEAFFASSGSNLVLNSNADHILTSPLYIVSGGAAAALFSPGLTQKQKLPLVQGSTSTGANAIAMWNNKNLVVVGGDFQKDQERQGNCALSSDGGYTWTIPEIPPHGYRSAVLFITETQLLACGTSGVDYSADGGRNWQGVSAEGFHVCQKAKRGDQVFLAGPKGKIARLLY